MLNPLGILAIVLLITVFAFFYFRRSSVFKTKQPIGEGNKLVKQGNTEKAKKKFDEALEDGNAEAYYHMGEMYYNKCTSDRDPYLTVALDYYKKAVASGYTDCSVRIADIYNFCNIPEHNIPNKHLAKEIYLKLINTTKDKDIKIDANNKLADIRREEAVQNVRGHQTNGPVPAGFQAPPRVDRNNPIGPRQPTIHRDLPAVGDNLLREMGILIQPVNIPLPQAPPDNRIRNDSQNAHDSGVQRGMRNTIDKLRDLNRYNQYAKTPDKTFQEIKEYIQKATNLTKQNRSRALITLDKMMRGGNAQISETGTNEREIMSMVWNRIHSNANKKNIDNLKESLALQLADGATNGTPVCPSGRVTRVLSSLDKIDADPTMGELKPKWALKEELNSLAARVREQVLETATPQQKEAYNSPTTTPEGEALADQMKNEIQRRCDQDYRMPNLLTHQEITTELEPILNAI